MNTVNELIRKLQTVSEGGYGDTPVFFDRCGGIREDDGDVAWDGDEPETVSFLGTPNHVIVHAW